MKRFGTLLLFLLLIRGVAAAEPVGRVERDLGDHLAYVRVHRLPADLPPANPKPTAMVLDLRFTSGDATAAAALGAWLQFRASARTPVFVLVNGSTARPVLDFFETVPLVPGVTTVGIASSHFVPDIPMKVDATVDRNAYEALEKGATVESLLTDQPGKARYDEAAIAKEHADAAEGNDSSDAPPDERAAPEAKPAPPPLIDAPLQRAVHLHRALRALRRI